MLTPNITANNISESPLTSPSRAACNLNRLPAWTRYLLNPLPLSCSVGRGEWRHPLERYRYADEFLVLSDDRNAPGLIILHRTRYRPQIISRQPALAA